MKRIVVGCFVAAAGMQIVQAGGLPDELYANTCND